MSVLLTNNAITRLAASIDATATSIAVTPGEGAKFPAPPGGDYFPLTIIKPNGQVEIVKATARTADVITIERAQEGTMALAFTAGDRVELRLTANTFYMLFPTGTGPLPWSRASAPPGWIFADGRVLLAATPYSDLRAAYIADGFPYGQDGSGNPFIPDCRGRVVAGKDDMSGATANRLTSASGVAGNTLGAAGGAEGVVLTPGQLASHSHGVSDPTHAHAVYDPGHAHGLSMSNINNTASTGANSRLHQSGGSATAAAATGIAIYGAATGISIVAQGSNQAHPNVQPTLVTNMIVKT